MPYVYTAYGLSVAIVALYARHLALRRGAAARALALEGGEASETGAAAARDAVAGSGGAPADR